MFNRKQLLKEIKNAKTLSDVACPDNPKGMTIDQYNDICDYVYRKYDYHVNDWLRPRPTVAQAKKMMFDAVANYKK